MASIVKVMDWKEINVSQSVGKGGVNRHDDVMVVQALLKYGLEDKYHFRKDNFPAPNGIMDKNTLRLIRKFQRYLRKIRKVKVAIDGRIDPSKGLYVRNRKKLIWTISHLNCEAVEMKLIYNKGRGTDYIQAVRSLYPQVDAILAGNAVGTLNLGLE